MNRNANGLALSCGEFQTVQHEAQEDLDIVRAQASLPTICCCCPLEKVLLCFEVLIFAMPTRWIGQWDSSMCLLQQRFDLTDQAHALVAQREQLTFFFMFVSFRQ